MVTYGTVINYQDKNFDKLKKEALKFVEEHEDATWSENNIDITIGQISKEELAATIRERRNKLLEETDKDCLSDREPSSDIITYRQALRDITKQDNFPYGVKWPTKPTDEQK